MKRFVGLNAPTGAWCSLTSRGAHMSAPPTPRLNAPTGAWCSLTIPVGVCIIFGLGLNAPTGAWCSLTPPPQQPPFPRPWSQCTYRCVVLPDHSEEAGAGAEGCVSMHLQVRGAP